MGIIHNYSSDLCVMITSPIEIANKTVVLFFFGSTILKIPGNEAEPHYIATTLSPPPPPKLHITFTYQVEKKTKSGNVM